jgi:hypothetical protein
MSFPEKVKEDAMIACGRHCALCHRFCGLKIELHHIRHRSEGGTDTYENCLPLCFDCHADMRSYDHQHPKGTKYTADELRRHRDEWYAKVRSSGGPRSNSNASSADKKLFERLLLSLRWESEIAFLRNHDFTGSFRNEKINPFHDFYHEQENPAAEFLDSDLEALRSSLVAAVGTFLDNIGQYTFVRNINTGVAGVEKEWEYRNPEAWQEAITKLNSSSNLVVEQYAQLLRACRHKLDQ